MAGCFLIAGFFLLIFSDTEIWPFGYQSLYYAVTHNPEDAQHKTFALILLLLGVIEMLRSSGRLKAAWSAWVFPVVALGGAVMLLFHHHGGMHGPDAMQTMHRARSTFAICGSGGWSGGSQGAGGDEYQVVRIFQQGVAALYDCAGVMLLMYTE